MRPDFQSPSPSSVFFKTGRGRAELVRRAAGLSAFERALLITVDGRQDVAALFAALGRKYPEDRNGLAAVTRLTGLGLIASLAQPDDASTGGSTHRRSLALARLHLIESMARMLRGHTAHLPPLLRAAADETSLLNALDVCHPTLIDADGLSQVDAMRTRCLELLPASPPGPPEAAGR